MNRSIAAVLVTLSIAAGVGTGYLVQRANDEPAEAGPPDKTSQTPDTRTPDTRTPDDPASTDPLVRANRADRAAARLPSWSPADPTGPDGKLLEVGNIVPGAIEPVKAGDTVHRYMREGYLVADQDPPCDGNSWLWAGQLSEGLVVSASPRGQIGALGTDKDTLETAEGIGVGSSLAALKRTYAESLNPVTANDYGAGWTFVKEQDGFILFSFDEPADRVTDASRVVFVEVGVGQPVQSFVDAC